MITGIGKTAAFGACHRMTADEASFKSELGYFFVDNAFYTAYICEDTVLSRESLIFSMYSTLNSTGAQRKR